MPFFSIVFAKAFSHDDVFENMYITQEISSKSRSERDSFSDIGNEGISSAKTDAAIKLKE